MTIGGNYLNKKKHPFVSSCKDLEGREGDELGPGLYYDYEDKKLSKLKGSDFLQMPTDVFFLNSSLLDLPHLDLL